MDNPILQQVVERAVTVGPAALMHGRWLRRPSDVVRASSLSQDDKRAILAAWASDLNAVVSQPALRKLPGTIEPVSIDEVQAALRELDRQS
ncbi:hypothetical protein [Rhizobium sp. 2MFCol3.1]|uniref:hypothetical protein n=1 Tax=Rhizobium sp. 2MFCol3.1 TaxID=1246459 RepID=UPI00035EA85B|nr:hypothetical protein [Rhizobium sp. 2MFCol3.1]